MRCTPIDNVTMDMQAQGHSIEPQKRREVAVTFDDLPVISVTRHDIAFYREITNKLVEAITANTLPAIGFVNENKLHRRRRLPKFWGTLDGARVALLQQWLDEGLELGNHTFSHPDLHTTPPDSFRTDVIRGETVISKLLRRKGMRLRYFRHPFLHTGTDLETKRNFEEFLAGRGYRIAPVSINTSDWIFAAAYAKAAERGDQEMMREVAAAYIPFTEARFDYCEKQSVALFGYEIKQILLLHANVLNADQLSDLLQALKRRGYSFISLEEALSDKAYASPDEYTGEKGITWLHRWAWTAGKQEAFFADEPVTPEFVMKEAGVTEE